MNKEINGSYEWRADSQLAKKLRISMTLPAKLLSIPLSNKKKNRITLQNPLIPVTPFPSSSCSHTPSLSKQGSSSESPGELIIRLQAELEDKNRESRKFKTSLHRLQMEYDDYRNQTILREDAKLVVEELKELKQRYGKLQAKYDDLVTRGTTDKVANDTMVRIMRDAPEKYSRVFEAIISLAPELHPQKEEEKLTSPTAGVHQIRNQKRKLKRREVRSQQRLQNFKEVRALNYSVKKLFPTQREFSAPPESSSSKDPRRRQPSSKFTKKIIVDLDENSAVEDEIPAPDGKRNRWCSNSTKVLSPIDLLTDEGDEGQ